MNKLNFLLMFMLFSLASNSQETYTYTYDAYNRLIKVESAVNTRDFQYDIMGNRLSETTISQTTMPNTSGGVIISTLNSPEQDVQENLGDVILVLKSKEKGFVITRMASPETTIGTGENAIPGMLVYDTDDHCFKLYNGSSWGCITLINQD